MESSDDKRSVEPNPRGTAPEAVRAPAPALPKGGGAIRAIGEKFSTNPVTGTGSLAIPLPVSPARSGFHPELTLTYDSGAGNGPFGLGWHLSVPAITRKTDKRLPEYLDADDSDVFLLSGAEDLVPVLDDDGARVSFERDGEWIDRYRPRIEGMFARIERRRDLASGLVYWKSITPANVTNTYGRDARIQHPDDDPDAAPRVFSWLLERSQDAAGNLMVYEYAAEDLAGVAPSAGEAHRLDGRARVTNRYLKRVRYGNTTPGDAATCMFEIVLDYGEHDQAVPRPDDVATWPARADAFSSYRAGFEVRTYRLCQRALLFHRFPELGDQPCLVRSLSLTYATEPRSTLTRLASARLSGHKRAPGATTYTTQSFPALTLAYTEAAIHTDVRDVDRENLGDLLGGVDGATHRWVDLDGEGIPGLLSELGGALYYRRNLGGAALEGPRTLLTRPQQTALAAGGQQLMDLGGDGRLDLVDLDAPLAGYHERIPPGSAELEPSRDPAAGTDGGWAPFQAFASQPVIDWKDPNVLFLDLDGDGLDDVVISGDELFTWYPSQGKDGFGPPRGFPRPRDDEQGPAVVFSDRSGALITADLSGDGLRDLVRISNGGICYWPNLGHGRFGAPVTMSGAPRFDEPDQFDGRRILLADIDGSGTTDILYVHRDGVKMWFNQAGNGWSPTEEITDLPVHSASHVTAVDLLGTGTACLVWSTPLPGPDGPRLRYVDLLDGVKPHLMAQIDNGLGLTTWLQYRPSTAYYLADRAAGIPWASRLAFPVHVVSRVETYDVIRRVRFTSEYLYRDGYYDGHEREFRGFAYVEQRDTESDPALSGIGLYKDRPPAVNGEYPQPPVVTMSWFHTGAWPPLALPEGPPMAFLPEKLTADELRDAHRALKGALLRQEIRCDDGSLLADLPYAVTENGYQVRREQPAQGRSPAVFATFPRETIERHIERNPDDARIQHSLTLEVDPFGHTKRAATIAYPRRPGAANIQPEQQTLLATLAVADFADQTTQDEWYRHGVPLQTWTYELTGLAHDGFSPALSFETVLKAATDADEVAYDAAPPPSSFGKRLVERARTRYRDCAALPVDRPLPWRHIDRWAMSYESYGLAFTPSLLTSLYRNPLTDEVFVTNDILVEGGYTHLDDPDDVDSVTGWWAPTGRALPTGPFLQPREFRDPWGNVTSIDHDSYGLLVRQVTDALGNALLIDNDYRSLGPSLITDANLCRSSAELDELGRVVATRVMGPAGSTEGDPSGDPTTRLEYGFYEKTTGRPSWSHVAAREAHGDGPVSWQQSYSYADGTGREVMMKVQAEPGTVRRRGSDGSLEEAEVAERWVGTGRTVFDNKGNPIKHYEPFFSDTHEYQTDEEIVVTGVTPLLHYDPLGRLVLTEFADGSTARAIFSPWENESWDRNDTIADADNRWMQEHGSEPGGLVAATHAGTQLIAVTDVLGVDVLLQADNKDGPKLETRTTFDIEGNPLVVTDALGRQAMVRRFSMLGQACEATSIDAGKHWALVNVAGQPLRVWTTSHVTRTTYDNLRRPIGHWVSESGSDRQVERFTYGEDHPDPVPLKLIGKLYQHRDAAGLITNEEYDFKGNLRRATRQLMVDHAAVANWADSPEPAVDDERFSQGNEHDALNRVTGVTLHDGTRIRLTYNQAGLLDRVDAQLRGVDPWTTFVRNIDYDAKGQRTRIAYGAAAVTTTFEYDPYTFRLKNLTTRRDSDGAYLQALAYHYDPVGNIVRMEDGAQQEIYFGGQVAEPAWSYDYDAIYRLISAEGRELAGGIADLQRCQTDAPIRALPHPNDTEAVRPYRQEYVYDRVSNLLEMKHQVSDTSASWTRYYDYAPGTNRLSTTQFSNEHSETGTYVHDARGNMTSMPHLPGIEWDFRDLMRRCTRSDADAVTFIYDSSGQRVRKLYQHGAYLDETIYLGAYEVYRRRNATTGAIQLERETIHIAAGATRVAMVETKTLDVDEPTSSVTPRIRFQLDNHLGSACVEVDPTGSLISYEEFHPYGTTSFRASASGTEVSAKRYRYTGKERDEETGLYYHGARYYSPWLGRWTAPDPAGLVDGPNLYAYCRGQPTVAADPTGTKTQNLSEQSVLNIVDRTLTRKGIAYNTEVTMKFTLPDGTVVIRRFDRVYQDPASGRWIMLEAKGANPNRLTKDQMLADKWIQENGARFEVLSSAGRAPGAGKSEGIKFQKGFKGQVEAGDLHYTTGKANQGSTAGMPSMLNVYAWDEGMEGQYADVQRPEGAVLKSEPNKPPYYITQEEAARRYEELTGRKLLNSVDRTKQQLRISINQTAEAQAMGHARMAMAAGAVMVEVQIILTISILLAAKAAIASGVAAAVVINYASVTAAIEVAKQLAKVGGTTLIQQYGPEIAELASQADKLRIELIELGHAEAVALEAEATAEAQAIQESIKQTAKRVLK